MRERDGRKRDWVRSPEVDHRDRDTEFHEWFLLSSSPVQKENTFIEYLRNNGKASYFYEGLFQQLHIQYKTYLRFDWQNFSASLNQICFYGFRVLM